MSSKNGLMELMMEEIKTNALNLFFKPSNLCNLHCVYCSAENLKSVQKKSMTIDEMHDCFNWILDYSKYYGINNIHVMWHGGEPLLLGYDFFSSTISYYSELFKSNNIHFDSSIQTNILLISGQYYQLLHKYFKSSIGFSYDFQSETRLYPDGKNAADDIIKKAQAIKNDGFDIRAICMLTPSNIDKVIPMFHFFKDLGINFRLNRIIPPEHGTLCAKELAYSITWDQYAKAMCQLLDEWLADKSASIKVSPLDIMIEIYLNDKSQSCDFGNPDLNGLISIGPGGQLYPCSRFDGQEYILGTIYDSLPQDVIKRREELIHKSQSLPISCETCECYGLCNGGCFHSRLIGWQKDQCRANQAIWKHINESLSALGLYRGCMKKNI